MKARKYFSNGDFVIVDIEEDSTYDINSIIGDIYRLKQELESTDYKVTKIAEALSIGAELPYDAQELHKERQALRDRINELENELKRMEVQSVEDEQ